MMTKHDRLFGMALGRMELPPGDIPDFFTFSHFSAVELPVEHWTKPADGTRRSLPLGAFRSISCGNIMETALCGVIAHTLPARQKAFADEAGRVLRVLADKGVSSAVLDCNLEEILGDPEAEEAMRRIVLRLAPVLIANGMTLILPFRAPSRHQPGELGRFLRRSLLPCVRTRLEVHPFEREAPKPETSGGALRLDLHSILFVYDADSGSRIRKSHVQPWLDWTERLGVRIPFLLCPKSRRQRMALPEASSWDGIAEELQNG